MAAAVGLFDYAAYGGALGDDEFAAGSGDGLDYLAVEVVAGTARLDADVLIDTDGEGRSGGGC